MGRCRPPPRRRASRSAPRRLPPDAPAARRYAAALLSARRLPLRALVAAVLAAQLIFALGPPLISQDVFGYLGFARMGALHALDPYTRLPAEAPSDSVFPFIGWPYKHSPYGPL